MEISVWIPVLLAAIAAVSKVVYDIVNGVRQAQLARTTAQLKCLYGPLRALQQAGDSTWLEFRKEYRAGKEHYFNSEPPPSEDELEAWKLWMTEVFVPLHREMERIILANVHLVEQSAFPQCFDELLAHAAGYKTTLKKWEQSEDLSRGNGYRDYQSVLEYPAESLREYIENTFKELSEKQHRWLNPLNALAQKVWRGENLGSPGMSDREAS